MQKGEKKDEDVSEKEAIKHSIEKKGKEVKTI